MIIIGILLLIKIFKNQFAKSGSVRTFPAI